jgi:glycosyltransferase involved in cell wall biosynthesis
MGVYNGAAYLDEAVASVLDQTFADFEFLIIDDASTDDTPVRLRRWAERDARIRLVTYTANRGLGYVLDDGMRRARASLVARMDVDDIALPDRLEAQVDFMRRHPDVDILGGWAEDCDEASRVIGYRTYPTRHDDLAPIMWTIPIIHPTVMMRREPVCAVGSYDPTLRRRQDYDLWMRALAHGLRFANLPKTLIRYRFTDTYYQKNDWRVAWLQTRIGWTGCWRAGLGVTAYVGVAWPFVRSMFPAPVGKWMHRQAHRFDPRRR